MPFSKWKMSQIKRANPGDCWILGSLFPTFWLFPRISQFSKLLKASFQGANSTATFIYPQLLQPWMALQCHRHIQCCCSETRVQGLLLIHWDTGRSAPSSLGPSGVGMANHDASHEPHWTALPSSAISCLLWVSGCHNMQSQKTVTYLFLKQESSRQMHHCLEELTNTHLKLFSFSPYVFSAFMNYIVCVYNYRAEQMVEGLFQNDVFIKITCSGLPSDC